MIKALTVAVALSSLVSLPASAAPKKMPSEMLDQVVAGTDYCPPPPEVREKGNNGWGNGADPSNPGSPNGGTAASKIANVNLLDANQINTNPTTSTGR